MYELFLGIHCADGTLPKYKGRNQYLWEFSDRDKEAAEFVAELVKKDFREFSPNVHIRQRGNQYVVFVKNKKFWLILTEQLKLPIGKKSETIDMPECVKPSGYKDFVNGVINSDDFVFKDHNGTPRIRITIHSKPLRDSLSRLLSHISIIHTTGESEADVKPPKSNKTYHVKIYRLDIYGKNAIDYFKKVGIWHPIKKQKFEEYLNSVRDRETGAPR